MKKHKLFITCFFCFLSFALNAQWEWQNPKPQGNDLNDVQFFNNHEGWAVGDYGTIMHTTDGGVTWEFQASGTTEDLNKLYLYDDLTLWIVGSSGCILNTENGGDNWTSQASGINLDLVDVSFTDSVTGWTLASEYVGWDIFCVILFTENGGLNWNIIYQDSTLISLNSIHFLNDTIGRGVGYKYVDSIQCHIPVILYTNDMGFTWEIQPNSPYISDFIDVYFTNSNEGWVLGYSQGGDAIFHTEDGGNTWVTQYNSSIVLNSVYFIDNEIGWAAGRTSPGAYPGSPKIVRTTNGGDTWQLATVPYYPTCRLNSIHFSDMDNGWAVGGIGLILKTDDGGLNWSSQSEGTAVNSLNDICFVDSLYGWATGHKILLYTQDGGSSWAEQGFGNFWSKSTCFTDHNNGWIVGEDMFDGGVVIYTNDGGDNWEQQYNETGNEYTGVCFVDSVNGWVTGALGRILHTNTGGDEWETQNSGTNEYLWDVFFIDQNNGWTTGSNGMILHTNNGGILWTEQISGTNEDLHSIHFWNSENGGAVGENGTIILTTDGGISWELQISGQICDLYGVFLTSSENVWVVGSDYIVPDFYSVILNTSDGGSTWESQTKPSALNRRLGSIWFTDQNNGWVVGGYGTILHTDNGGVTGFEESNIQSSQLIFHSFPNPFSNQTTIEFTLNESELVTLSIYDITCKQLKTILSKKLSKGNHKINWNAEGLNEGIYFIRLETNEGIKTIKMIKLK